MTRRVKLPKVEYGLGMGEIADDDLSLDELSRGEETAASQDVSDYDDNPKDAPRRIFIGEERCRKMFQLQNDIEQDIMRVCGGKEECRRQGHKNEPSRGAPGSYETIRTSTYADGILSSFRTEASHLAREAEERAIKRAAMTHLTGTKAYRNQVRAAAEEEEHADGGEDAENEDGGTLYESTGDGEIDDWGEDSDYEEVVSKTEAKASAGISPHKTPKRGSADRRLSKKKGDSPADTEIRRNTGTHKKNPASKRTEEGHIHGGPPPGTTADVVIMVAEMKDAMKEMAEAMSFLLRSQGPAGGSSNTEWTIAASPPR
jgi:hypothetical protein